MKILILALFVFSLVALPLYLLNSVVMPELMQLQTTYAHADAIANQVAGQR